MVHLFWYATDGSLQRVEIDFETPGFDPVSGPMQIPFHLEQPLDFTSPMVGFEVEGGGPGDDLVIGGPGDDDLNGGDGTDRCIGGPGVNTFIQC